LERAEPSDAKFEGFQGRIHSDASAKRQGESHPTYSPVDLFAIVMHISDSSFSAPLALKATAGPESMSNRPLKSHLNAFLAGA
jgi:hypothetical protein